MDYQLLGADNPSVQRIAEFLGPLWDKRVGDIKWANSALKLFGDKFSQVVYNYHVGALPMLRYLHILRVMRWIVGNYTWMALTQAKSFGLIGMFGPGNAAKMLLQAPRLLVARLPRNRAQVSAIGEANAAVAIKHGGYHDQFFPIESTLCEKSSSLATSTIHRKITSVLNWPSNTLEFILDNMGAIAAERYYAQKGFKGDDLKRARFIGTASTQCLYNKESRPIILNNELVRFLRPMMSYGFVCYNNLVWQLGGKTAGLDKIKAGFGAAMWLMIMQLLIPKKITDPKSITAVQAALAGMLQMKKYLDPDDITSDEYLEADIELKRLWSTVTQDALYTGVSWMPFFGNQASTYLRRSFDNPYPWEEDSYYEYINKEHPEFVKGFLGFLRKGDVFPEAQEIATSIAAAQRGNNAQLARLLAEYMFVSLGHVGGPLAKMWPVLTPFKGGPLPATKHLGNAIETGMMMYDAQQANRDKMLMYGPGKGPGKGDVPGNKPQFELGGVENLMDTVLSLLFGPKNTLAAAKAYNDMALEAFRDKTLAEVNLRDIEEFERQYEQITEEEGALSEDLSESERFRAETERMQKALERGKYWGR